MMINRENIATDLTIGKTIFENLPNDLKPYWSGLVLSTFSNYIKEIPISVWELHSIIGDKNRWSEAHAQFSKIREFLLHHKHFPHESFLLLAENIAKVTYNASNQPAPFDADSGWYIPSLALQTAHSFKDIRLMNEVQATILVFNNNEEFKNNIQAAKEYLVCRKIDEILWFDWDPIGINEIDDARNEYEGYVPEIFHLKKASTNSEEIAMCLFKIETERIGLSGMFENCLAVAEKIVRL